MVAHNREARGMAEKQGTQRPTIAGAAKGTGPQAEQARGGGGAALQAVAFLVGKGPPSPSAIAGLHQTLHDAALAHRLVEAGKRGARLGARVNAQGKTPQQIVQDPAFEWEPAGPAPAAAAAAAPAAASGSSAAAASAGPVQRKQDLESALGPDSTHDV